MGGAGSGSVSTSSTGGGIGGEGGIGGGGEGGTGGEGGGREPSWTQVAELPEPGAQEEDFATTDVSLHEETAALSGAGNARVFVRQGQAWVEQQAFAPDAAVDIDFGASVAVFGDTLLVGAPRDAGGSVYVLERTGDTWNEAGRLRPSDDIDNGWFGLDVALHESTALVGTWQGTAYVFSRDSGGAWSEEQRLVPNDDDGADRWTSVAIESETALVASYDTSGNTNGSAYIFEREPGGWELQQELVPDATDEGADFGAAVGLSDDFALVGAPYDRDFRGAVHVFSREGATWRRDPVLLGDDADDGFGQSLAIHDDVAVIANWRHNDYSGSVRVLERSGASWELKDELASAGEPLDRFGASVSVFGDTALIAAPGYGEFDDWFGSAYVFERLIDQ